MTRSALASHWDLDPAVTYLNHGAFGATPRVVLEHQRATQSQIERNPMAFMVDALEPATDHARAVLGDLVGSATDDLAFVTNATVGVNTILASYPFRRGDEIVVTDHGYNACTNAARFHAERAGAKVVVAQIPFPIANEQQVLDAIDARCTAHTRLLLVDHVTSPTAMVFPLRAIVARANERGIDTVVDGAHAPGMVPFDLASLDATFYTANLHKWLLAPKGAGFLRVRPDRRDSVRPLVISHGANAKRTDRSRFHLEFDWIGTDDPSAYLAVPACVGFFRDVIGGLDEARTRNHLLALRGRDIVCNALGIEPPVPDAMLGTMASLILPHREVSVAPPFFIDPLQRALAARGIVVPVFAFEGKRVLRVSAQLYNHESEYHALADAVRELL